MQLLGARVAQKLLFSAKALDFVLLLLLTWQHIGLPPRDKAWSFYNVGTGNVVSLS